MTEILTRQISTNHTFWQDRLGKNAFPQIEARKIVHAQVHAFKISTAHQLASQLRLAEIGITKVRVL